MQPKSGLTKGEYLEDISVQNSGNVECYVNAHFSVTKKTDDNSNNLTGIKKPSDITDLPNGTEKSSASNTIVMVLIIAGIIATLSEL